MYGVTGPDTIETADTTTFQYTTRLMLMTNHQTIQCQKNHKTEKRHVKKYNSFNHHLYTDQKHDQNGKVNGHGCPYKTMLSTQDHFNCNLLFLY